MRQRVMLLLLPPSPPLWRHPERCQPLPRNMAVQIGIASVFFICAPLAALNAATGDAAPVATKPAALAASGALPAASAKHGSPQSAQSLGHKGGFVTNSMLVTWMVAVGVILFARFATRKIQEVPSGAQNFWEWLVEGLYGFLESIME